MPRCAKCQNSGLTLKLDFDGFCQSCHSWRIKDYEKDIAERDAELAELRAFHAEYVVIPDAKVQSRQIIMDAQDKAESIVKSAKSEADDITEAAEEIMDKARDLEQLAKSTSNIILAELDEKISLLLKESSKEFHFRARGKVADMYLKTEKLGKDLKTTVSFKPLSVAAFKKAASQRGYITFDLETTGLSPRRDKIIEIGAMKFSPEGEELGQFQTLVNPGRPIPPSASNVNGITDDMVADAPTIDVALADFIKFVGDEDVPLIAHNANFDVSFLDTAMTQLQFQFQASYGDSIKLAKSKYKIRSYALDAVCDHIDYHMMDQHRALGDADAIAAIVMECLDD